MEIKPYLRIPIKNKENELAQIDRNTHTLKVALAYSLIKDYTKEIGPIHRLYINCQIDWGKREFKYSPDSTLSGEISSKKSSFSGELNVGYYKTKGESFAKQFAPEFRIRYSNEFIDNSETGIILSNTNGISSIHNMVTSEPINKPTLSPAFSFNYYPGQGQFSYTPAIFYEFTGANDAYSPFRGYSRIRIEGWIFYYPIMTNKTGVKIGLSPFISIITSGNNVHKGMEFGGMIQYMVGRNMLHFF